MLDLDDHKGILLDIACGANKQQGYVGLDIQPLEGVDIIQDINVHPWRDLEDECVLRSVASHIVEHIPPVQVTSEGTRFPFIEFMNEVWRITKVGGQLAIVAPHGYSSGYLQDPTHCNALNETTWSYFDPFEPRAGGILYPFYRPKPWRVSYLSWDPSSYLEVVLVKRSLEEVAELYGQLKTA